MKAVRLLDHGAPGRHEVGDQPDPSPGADEVVVRVRACGLNHLDLWCEQGALPVPITLPRIQGCEIAGEIAATGPGVPGWNPGDRVAVQSNLFCGTCEFCQRGDESMCLHHVILGVQRDGGFAEKVLVPCRAVSPLPATVDFTASAALTLAGSTAMHMLTNRGQVRRGDWVLVLAGASGVGSAAIQIARHLGGRVLATASSEPKRALCRQLGAEAALDSLSPDWPAEVRRLTGKRGADLVIEHLGGRILEQVLQCLGRGGTIVTCGATTGREIALDLWPFFVKQQRLIGSYGRNRADFDATLAWAADGRLRPVIDRVFPLEAAPAALAALRARGVLGKLVVCP